MMSNGLCSFSPLKLTFLEGTLFRQTHLLYHQQTGAFGHCSSELCLSSWQCRSPDVPRSTLKGQQSLWLPKWSKTNGQHPTQGHWSEELVNGLMGWSHSSSSTPKLSWVHKGSIGPVIVPHAHPSHFICRYLIECRARVVIFLNKYEKCKSGHGQFKLFWGPRTSQSLIRFTTF